MKKLKDIWRIIRLIKQTNTLIPYPIIEHACSGDIESIEFVLKHFDKYIIALCNRPLYDEFGNSFVCIDEEMRHRLETKLITAMLSFELT